MSKKVLILMTGGTIAQSVDSNGKMQIAKTIDDLVDGIETTAHLSKHSFGARTGANLKFSTLQNIRNYIIENQSKYDGFVLITGTDSMEELAFVLDCTLRLDQPIVLTGAMKPSDIDGFDGVSNLTQAIEVASRPQSKGRGVLLCMNDSIHLARYVRKHDTQLIGAFVSHPGPVGQIRRGEVYFYYDNAHSDNYYDISPDEKLNANVQSLIFTFGLSLPREMLPRCDGLVIAGMGTSSISEEWINELSKDWTQKIPIVLVSRCVEGTNYDDSYYRGSLTKYEDLGFKLSGYTSLNIMQARLKLILELSAAH